MIPINFKTENTIPGQLGRAGILSTPHGDILTPAFVAVGTKATVKSLTPEQVRETGSQVVLANTYHLHLQPGEKIIKEVGGLGKFMGWRTKSGNIAPTFTDSGGFQAFSLGVAYGEGIGKFIGADIQLDTESLLRGASANQGKKAKVTEEGVEFVSILDGSRRFMSPEDSIRIQQDIGADMIFALDEFTSPHADKEQIKSTIERTERWAKRCLHAHNKNSLPLTPPEGRGLGWVGASQGLFGIVQGGRYEDLRKESARGISSLPFHGFGIGGTFVKEDMATAVRWVNEILPENKPRHLLGVGEPVDLFLGVENGCDTFDCVAATRMARNGSLYTRGGKINILNAKFSSSLSPIDMGCTCYTCRNYTSLYLNHLFKAKEMLAATLSTIHNLTFLNTLMSQIRQSILDSKFSELKEEFLRTYTA